METRQRTPKAITFLAWVVLKAFPSAGFEYRQRRFGLWWGTFIWAFRLVDTDALQRRHWDLHAWSDTEVQQWKDSHLSSCNAIAVAGAIFATLGVTALQIPDMNYAWWAARACCVASMVLGVFSVTTATRQHFAAVMLKSPLDVRLWMSRGLPTRTRRREDLGFLPPYHEVHVPEKYKDMYDFQGLALESSMSTLKAVALPRHLLDLSVVLFMVGIGLYELSGWKTKPNFRSTEYRNVFIVFIVTVVTYLIYHTLILIGAAYDTNKKDDEFGTGSLRGAWGESDELRELRRRLKNFRTDIPKELDLATVLEQLSEELGARRRVRHPTLEDRLRLQRQGRACSNRFHA